METLSLGFHFVPDSFPLPSDDWRRDWRRSTATEKPIADPRVDAEPHRGASLVRDSRARVCSARHFVQRWRGRARRMSDWRTDARGTAALRSARRSPRETRWSVLREASSHRTCFGEGFSRNNRGSFRRILVPLVRKRRATRWVMTVSAAANA